MAAAPQVRDLQSLIGTLQQGIAPQQQQINSEIAQNDQAGQAQIAGLGAQKTQAFNDITQGAQNNGMFFSGFSPDQEAKYTAGTYLPKLAELQATIANTRNSLLGKAADLNTNVFNTAVNMQNSDRQALDNWNTMQEQAAIAAAAADKQNAFTAGQNALSRAATASNAAAAAVSPQKAALTIISKGLGGDGYVSPATFQVARDMYRQAGGDPHQFANEFWKYTGANQGQKNAGNWSAYYYG